MARLILEDIKLNKNRRKEIIIPSKKEEGISSAPSISKEDIQKEIQQAKEAEELNKQKIEKYFSEIDTSKKTIERTPQEKVKSGIISRKTIFLIITIFILGIFYWGGNVFHKVDISIKAKQENISYNQREFTATKNEDVGAIDFEIMITTDTKTKNIVLTEPKEVSIKAQGSVTLYNEFSTVAQKISTNTFLTDENGKTYKTNKTVTIPGYKLINKKIIPGQVDVEISAFLPGEVYNGSPASFSVNAFKGTTKYTKIYAKLKNPLTGGASGLVYILNDKDKLNIKNMAYSSFKDDLLSKVKVLVPPGYILYDGATTFTYKTDDNIFSKTAEAQFEIEGSLAVILLKEESLLNNIINISLPKIDKDEAKQIKIPNLNTLTFKLKGENQPITKDMDMVSFYLSGSLDAIWAPNTELLKTTLSGIHKDKVLSVLRQDKGIASAIVKIFPPWQKYLPEDTSKINIIID